MDSKFNIAIIVLVVLSQLGGALVKAWRKRQSAPEGQRSGGGVVVVPRSRQDSRTDSWSSGDSPAAGRTTWDSPESEESEESYWEEHRPGELDQSPAANSEHGRQHTAAPVAALIQQLAAAVPPVRQVAAESRTRPTIARGLSHVAGAVAATPRARAILKRTTLRDAILAQVVLAPPNGARRLRR